MFLCLLFHCAETVLEIKHRHVTAVPSFVPFQTCEKANKASVVAEDQNSFLTGGRERRISFICAYQTEVDSGQNPSCLESNSIFKQLFCQLLEKVLGSYETFNRF